MPLDDPSARPTATIPEGFRRGQQDLTERAA